MDTYSIIKQLTEKLSKSPLEEERIRALRPIDHVMDIDLKGFVFRCQFNLSDDQKRIHGQISDLNLINIDNEDLYKLLIKIGKVDFTEYLNKEIFNYIQSEIRKAKDLEAWDSDNMWYEPNNRFVQWFQIKNIDPESKVLKKDDTNNALWAIADDMRERKEKGEFETYMDAYRWAEKNISKKGVNITAKKLELAYHKAKSEGKIE